MKDKNVRIKDIASKANVSAGTVDRVLHNRGRVSEKVKEKILKIIKEMDYEPNLMARALGSNKVFRFATLIPDEQFDSYWHAPRIGVLKASKEVKQFGVQVTEFLFNPYDVNSFIEQANLVTEQQVDGVLLSPIFYREVLPFLEKWKSDKIPFVLFNTQIADYEPLSYIGQDSYQSGLLAGKLMHYGLPNPCSILIAHFDEDISNAAHLKKKEQGFRNYFAQGQIGQKYRLDKIELNSSNFSSFIKQLEDAIENISDLEGIFVTTSKAFEIASYLKQRRIKNIKIVGYDLLPKNVHFLNTGEISFLINQNPKGQGYWGIQHLANHLVFKKDVQKLKYLPLDIITKENVNYFLDDEDESAYLGFI
ncbi:substrate-binding domain-containing protein [Desertivirga arenae]|uniref:substrate-binding domain-containing protein n=1 Tax=Desertivirga arenae TaxID=2810309 RepID=UPI001A95B057|nr:substrate-binding domain-containing protein [Pedobacter sp. SYSU D00823]